MWYLLFLNFGKVIIFYDSKNKLNLIVSEQWTVLVQLGKLNLILECIPQTCPGIWNWHHNKRCEYSWSPLWRMINTLVPTEVAQPIELVRITLLFVKLLDGLVWLLVRSQGSVFLVYARKGAITGFNVREGSTSTGVHISFINWCIVDYEADALRFVR